MPNPDNRPIAYLDESTSGNAYVIAAVVLDQRSDQQRVRRLVRDAAPAGGFHAVVAEVEAREGVEDVLLHTRGVRGAVTVCAPITEHSGVENARQRCLATIATRLHDQGVRQLIMDSRDDLRTRPEDRRQRPNELDQATIASLRNDGGLDGLTIQFFTDDREPLLWLADAVAWRTRRALVDQDASQFRRLAPVTELREATVPSVRDRAAGLGETATGLQHHLDLFRARGVSAQAGVEADHAHTHDEPDADLYDRREMTALQRVDALRHALDQALSSRRAQTADHYFVERPSADTRRAGRRME